MYLAIHDLTSTELILTDEMDLKKSQNKIYLGTNTRVIKFYLKR